jgi:predicted phosphodiesterase
MVRIAFISDIHFGQFSRTTEFSVPGDAIQDETEGGKSLKESMISILKKHNVAYLCVAGDLTSKGSPQEFNYCEKELLDIAEKANISKENIILGLGNHDIDWKISGIYNSLDKSSFGDKSLQVLVREKYQKIAASASLINMDIIHKFQNEGPAPFSGIVECNEFVMFILNSGWFCTEDQEFPHGKLGTDQFEWFESNVTRYRNDPRWKIVLMHHHPFNYSYPLHGVDTTTLEEGSNFLDIIGRNDVHLVLHGHRHHPKAETNFKNEWEHPISFVCAGSLTVNAAHRNNGEIPNTLHIIELSDIAGVLKLFNYQFSSVQGWIPIKNYCDETPLDPQMMFGKIFDDVQRQQSIQKLKACSDSSILYEDLDESLKFLAINKLNEIIQIHLPNYKMIGKFPDEVILLKKGGQDD